MAHKKRKSYIFTNRKHSDKAIMSAILGGISLLSFAAVLFLAYKRGGEVPNGYGVTGILIALFSVIGLILGLRTVREPEKYHFFAWLGMVLNGLALAGISLVVYVGM